MDLPEAGAVKDEPLALAIDCVRQGKLGDAIVYLKSRTSGGSTDEVATGLLAAIYMQIGLTDKAVDAYEELIAAYPDNSLARFQLGLAQLGRGARTEALSTWRPLLDQEEDFMAHFHSALALLELRRNDEARKMLDVARERMPTSHPLFPKALDLMARLDSQPSGAAP